ncbi:hypothetical protein BXP70_24715 [Hymenobacter crusticola]|uniref:histidine kinase n=1 Tax=Hymenobacter crusticola TaxID=1770526 RepID=A0A243W6U4_9BACT|nr:hypothetical protein BXP70_24715 [Hymenobacter crusticola]
MNVVPLQVTQVESDTMQRLGRGNSWRYQPGQPPGWASLTTDDHTWPLESAAFSFGEGPPGWRGTGCFRIRFTLDSALVNRPLGLRILQDGGSEVYLDGHWLGGYGKVGASAATTQHERVRFQPLVFMCTTAGPHLLAIRYAKFDPWPPPYGGFSLRVATAERLIAASVAQVRLGDINFIAVTGTAVLALLHFFLYLFYPPRRANLYFSLYMASASATGLLVYLRWVATGMQAHWRAELGFTIGSLLGGMLLLTFVYSVCRITLSRPWLTGVGLAQACLLAAWLMRPEWNLTPVALGLSLVLWLDMFRVIAQAMRQHQPGIWLVALGTFGALLVPFIANGVWRSGPFDVAQQLMLQSCLLLLPICMSVYLAREFAATRRDLEAQLRQVAQLSAQTLAQQAEKHQLISAQNERLEATVQERTEEISQQNHILAAQRDEISVQADRLRVLDQEKTRFFTNITHEFRTPLTLLLGPAAQIAADTQEPATRQQATLMQGNARRLLHLVNQLLDLSRLEAGQQALHATPGDLVGFVRGLVGSFEPLAQQRGIAYLFTAEPAELWGCFDADKLEKVVVNLLSNAFKFTPSVGEIMVRLHAAPSVPGTPTWVELTVHDTGRGIAAAHLPHVFDRFYQADASTTREHEGTGIGLALTKELVELHSGTITLTSELGCGTTAVVRFPLLLAAETAAAIPNEPAGVYAAAAISQLNASAASSAASAALEAPLVLLIEDNSDVRAYVGTILGKEYQLLAAKDGEEGVALAREHLPELVLTDAMMPRLDGYGVCQQLKHDERTSHIPIVLLTAKADLPSKLQGLATGADAYLTKPFDRDELLAQIRNLLYGRRLLQETYRQSLASPPQPGSPTMEQVFLARVRQAVESALDDENLDVETLARELALSRTQLHRKLKALIGQAPGDFIRLVRLQRAHELLVSGAVTVAEAAYQVGYGNPNNFSTSFARHFGYAPSEARQRHVAVK